MAGEGPGRSIVFHTNKRESHTPKSGFKHLCRRLRSNWKISEHKEELTLDRLGDADILVFGNPREKFSLPEFDTIKSFVAKGGSVMILLHEGGEPRAGSNINYLLEEWGVMVNSDAVVRTVYYKYLHPKEVMVSNGVVNKSISRAAQQMFGSSRERQRDMDSLQDTKAGETDHGGLAFVYPYGATLNVQKPAVPILSTGYIAYPLNRPVGACISPKGSKGRIIVLGSTRIFDDEWLNKEENGKLLDVCLKWLQPAENMSLDLIDAENPDLNDYHYVPDTEALSGRLRCCLQEADELPKDFTKLFDDTLFKFDTDLVPEAIKLYKQLNVKHDVLTLIPPQFEAPLPPLQPAVFPPSLRELPPPALDQFDLDEHFASERVRLAHLTNKCTDEDVEYFVREAGEVLGVTKNLPQDMRTGKHVLEAIFRQLVQWKKLNPETATP
mmetsp:Transcript_7612/g.17496  ORF Transcript_7612/g.17496 Transcript_7612/m.17496 type:complete len:440 (-) Transcript_7612:84-1403(-)|eukprot:CAMPEP_0114555396 /NCGR_PEP_ID=MMETSP0114-20121206/8727_1 /TAXON_ID=31324 /ORGANISM="Goniomonas sp, Strain m" /LENGTH=439 /DNA_ID=CAMNT_0001740519 /DNA_START=106 /DNA_END=1425 /DNA_ORIENTATION=-